MYDEKNQITAKQEFKFVEVKPGNGPVVIFIDGFLGAGRHGHDSWVEQLSQIFPDNPWYHVHWETESLIKVGELVEYLSQSSLKKTLTAPISPAITVFWAKSLELTGKIGRQLGESLSKIKHHRFILIGHSLGARIIHQALEYLAEQNSNNKVLHVHLIGGGVTNQDWENGARAVKYYLYNYYSENDTTLKVPYKIGTLFKHNPAGAYPIEHSVPNIKNIDVTEFVEGHLAYKKNLFRFLKPKQIQKDIWRVRKGWLKDLLGRRGNWSKSKLAGDRKSVH